MQELGRYPPPSTGFVRTVNEHKLLVVHSKTRTSVQLGILLGLSGDGMGGGGAAATGLGGWGRGCVMH